MSALGEALLTDYALVTWVLAAVFALARASGDRASRRVWAAVGVSLLLCVASVFVHGESARTPAAVLALVLLVLA